MVLTTASGGGCFHWLEVEKFLSRKEHSWEWNPGLTYSKPCDFFRTLYCFNLLWGPSVGIDYYHLEGIWDRGLSFSVDSSERHFLITRVKKVPLLITHSTQFVSFVALVIIVHDFTAVREHSLLLS